jgi:hypothetical protein
VGLLEARAQQLEAELVAYRDSERVARTLATERFEAGLEVRSGEPARHDLLSRWRERSDYCNATEQEPGRGRNAGVHLADFSSDL